MAAIYEERVYSRAGAGFAYPPVSGVILYRGTLAAITAEQTLVPAGDPRGVAIAGLVTQTRDNRTDSDTAPVELWSGIYALATDAALTPADIGAAVYAVDNNTVSKDSTGGRLRAGTLRGFDGGRAWFEI